MGRSRDRSYSRSSSRSRTRSRSGSLSSTSSGRAAKARDWNGEGGYRLHLSDLAIGVSRHEIEKLFRPYGPLNEVWVASNPPCFSFINFRHRADGEKALKELDGKLIGGSRIGLSWARARNYGGRPLHSLRYRSPSPSHRRNYRDSYGSRRDDDRYSKRRYSRSRSRSPDYRRSGGSYRRRSPSSRSRSQSRTRSPSPRDTRREKHPKTSKREDERRHRRRSESNSASDDNRSSYQKNGKQMSRTPSSERHQATASNGINHNHINDRHTNIQVEMADILSLEQLVHLSLGDPEAGAVNFNVLKTLLLQMLKAMNLFNHKPTMSDHDERTIKEALLASSSLSSKPTKPNVKFDQDETTSQLDENDDSNNEIKQKLRRKTRDRSSDRLTTLEEKVNRFESQLNAFDQIPSNSELIDRAKQISKSKSDDTNSLKTTNHRGPILEIWQYTQLEKRLESAENGITRLASLLQDLISDMNDLKESHETIKQATDELKKQQDDLKKIMDTLNKEKHDWAKKSDVENLDEKIRNLQNLLASLRDRLDDLSNANADTAPMPDLSGFVTWDRLEDALKGIRESIERSSNDAAAALASARDNRRPVQVVERQSQTNSSGPVPVPSQRTDHSGDLSDFRTALHRLREDLDRLKQLVQDLINKGNLSAQDIEALKKLIEQLDQSKADKNTVNNELDKKADKRDLENRVLKKDFNAACNELSQNLNDYMQKFNVHDDTQKQDLEKMNRDIEGKLDRSELEELRDYIDKQLKKLKRLAKEQQQTQQQHVHLMSEDEAAGLRKQLIRFHCISCDRPIDVQPHPQQPSLPANQGMRPIQSPRPYTTYELDQIRQYQKSQQFSTDLSGGVADVYATVRQCGGSHTMTLPFKRQIKIQPTVPEETVISRSEVDIKGQDGIIYKGRIDVGNLPTVDMQKKNSVVILAPVPPQRSRSDLIPKSAPPQRHHESFVLNHDQEENGISPIIPNLEPALPRDDNFS
ncbi:unnamed protein product [Rotaria magnacalcarata]|uniref:RRM domain-containing protein n=1 Tax=Rotaria magnacalcarata TaxID=392030 RepID=A0A819LVQ7_9BILA|nr:unnamed protein product [Rotaria magnacalcarata]